MVGGAGVRGSQAICETGVRGRRSVGETGAWGIQSEGETGSQKFISSVFARKYQPVRIEHLGLLHNFLLKYN